jgi:hypothetical protein
MKREVLISTRSTSRRIHHRVTAIDVSEAKEVSRFVQRNTLDVVTPLIPFSAPLGHPAYLGSKRKIQGVEKHIPVNGKSSSDKKLGLRKGYSPRTQPWIIP